MKENLRGQHKKRKLETLECKMNLLLQKQVCRVYFEPLLYQKSQCENYLVIPYSQIKLALEKAFLTHQGYKLQGFNLYCGGKYFLNSKVAADKLE